MACTNVDLFTLLSGSPDTTGAWTITGAAGACGFPVTLNVDGGGAAVYNNGDTIGTDHTPEIDFTGFSPGGCTLSFTYAGGPVGCDDQEDVNIYIYNLGTIGTGSTVQRCDTDTVDFTLLSLVTGFVAGADCDYAWSGDIGTPPYSDEGTTGTPTAALDDTFDPSLASPGGGSGPGGNYTFTLTCTPIVPGGFTDQGCCDPVTVTVEIEVLDAFNAGTGSSVAVCP